MNIVSLITLINLKYLSKNEADKLNLFYKEIKGTDKIGYNKYNEITIENGNYYMFTDELFEDSNGDYYMEEELENSVDSYRVLTRLSEVDLALAYVKLDEFQLVNLEEFALKCNYPFKIIKSVKV